MRASGVVALTVLLIAGCSPGDDDAATPAAKVDLAPTFAPDATGPAAATGGTAPTATPVAGAPPSTAVSPGPATGSTPAVDGGSATVKDRSGDLTPSPLDAPPRWADLVGATLTRAGGTYELTVELGDAAPSGSDDAHTMNIATFYDLDGDGGIDREIWANLASGGWGAAIYGDGDARFGDDSGVTVTVEGGRLVLRFPGSHLAGVGSFRWAVASEWGRYEVIGTVAAARDDMPDGDAAVRFPS